MSVEMCPSCGTVLTSSLKFCVKCRRTVSEDRIKRPGEKRRDDEESPQLDYRLARRSSYDALRQFRTFFLTLSTLLLIALAYYSVMKFVLHEPVPFEDKIAAFVRLVLKR